MLKLLNSRFRALSSSYMSVSPKSQTGCLSTSPGACSPLLLALGMHTYAHMPNTPPHKPLLTIPITKQSESPGQDTCTGPRDTYHRLPAHPGHTSVVVNTADMTKVRPEDILCKADCMSERLLPILIPCIFPQSMLSLIIIYGKITHMLNSATL